MVLFLSLSLALACSPSEQFKIACETACKITDDEKGYVVPTDSGDKCLCGPGIDIKKFILKFPQNNTAPKPQDRVYIY